MFDILETSDSLATDPRVTRLLQALRENARHQGEVENRMPCRLTLPNGESSEVPEQLVDMVYAMVEAVHDGRVVAVVNQRKLLSTQEAADFLGVSRPTVVRLLEAGEIPFEKVGTHRRIEQSELVAFQRARRNARYQAIGFSVMDEDENFEQVLLDLREVRKILAEERRRKLKN